MAPIHGSTLKRRSNYASQFQSYNPEQEASSQLVIADSDILTDGGTMDVTTFLSQIKDDQEKCTQHFACQIKDSLTIGSSYKVLEIKEFKTRFGLKQTWQLLNIMDGSVVNVWASNTLAKYASEGGKLDHLKVRCMKLVTVTYHGYESGSDDAPTKYLFEFTDH